MSLLTHLLSVFVATNPPAVAVSNEIQRTTGISVTVPDATDPVKQELDKVMIADDEAQDEVDKWIRDNANFFQQGAGQPNAEPEDPEVGTIWNYHGLSLVWLGNYWIAGRNAKPCVDPDGPVLDSQTATGGSR